MAHIQTPATHSHVALAAAGADNNPSAVEQALEQERRNVVLHEAAAAGDTARVIDLLEQGAAVLSRDRVGETLLHHAALVGNADLVEILLKRGAVVNAVNSWGCTPLYDAAARGHLAAVEVLVQHGADVNAKLVLQHAAAHGHKDIVKILTDYGADVNDQSYYSYTSLRLAIDGGHPQTVKLLLECGADYYLDKDFDAVIGHVLKHGDDSMLTVLLSSGAGADFLA